MSLTLRLYIAAGRLGYGLPAEIGAAWTGLSRGRRVGAVAVSALLLWLCVGTLLAWPQFLPYFNPLAGGSAGGHRWLLDSNLDWGQDLIQLRRWMERNRIPRVKLSYFGSVFPSAYYGIDYACLPTFGMQNREKCHGMTELPIEAGWYVISVNHLHGLVLEEDPFREFRRLQPVDRIGYSMWVFRIESSAPGP